MKEISNMELENELQEFEFIESIKQQGKKKVGNLKLYDDFMFEQVMKNQEVCKIVLENLLKISIDKLEHVQVQKNLRNGLNNRYIRLDVYVKDGNNTVYNVEMQRTKDGVEKRTRFYQSTMDRDSLKPNAKFNGLNSSYIIFICTFDMFKKGLYRYTIKKTCQENKDIILEDGSTTVFFNTKGTKGEVDVSVKEFLHFVEGKIAESELHYNWVKRVAQEVTAVKQDEEAWRCFMFAKYKEDERVWKAAEEAAKKAAEIATKEGMEKGMEKGIGIGAEKGMRLYQLYLSGATIEEISEKLDLSLDVVRELVKKIS